jgi:hypothetical protein
MKKINFVAAALLAVSSFAASAADTLVLVDQGDGAYSFSGAFDSGLFDVNALFTLNSGSFLTSGSVTTKFTAKKDIDFSAVYIKNTVTNQTFNFTQTADDTSIGGEQWTLGEIATPSGSYALHLIGTNTLTGGATITAYGGEMNVTAVPEPSSYALLLAGLGAVGFVARRRKAA